MHMCRGLSHLGCLLLGINVDMVHFQIIRLSMMLLDISRIHSYWCHISHGNVATLFITPKTTIYWTTNPISPVSSKKK